MAGFTFVQMPFGIIFVSAIDEPVITHWMHAMRAAEGNTQVILVTDGALNNGSGVALGLRGYDIIIIVRRVDA